MIPAAILHALMLRAGAPPAAPVGPCAKGACAPVSLPAKAPERYPVSIRYSGVLFVVPLDDCLAIAKGSEQIRAGSIGKVLDYYAVAKELLPPSRKIDLGERSGDDVARLLFQALERNAAYVYDPLSPGPQTLVVRCVVAGGAESCEQHTYCLSGKPLLSGAGKCP